MDKNTDLIHDSSARSSQPPRKRGSAAATNDERLDGENGLLLAASIDHLFGYGSIGFEDSGRLIISAVDERAFLQRMGVETERLVNVGEFSQGQRAYLPFHGTAVLAQADK